MTKPAFAAIVYLLTFEKSILLMFHMLENSYISPKILPVRLIQLLNLIFEGVFFQSGMRKITITIILPMFNLDSAEIVFVFFFFHLAGYLRF